MSKITDEANRIIKMTNDSRYMGYSFVSEAQQQAVNVLQLNKKITELKEQSQLRELHIEYVAASLDNRKSDIQELAEALNEAAEYYSYNTVRHIKYKALAKQHLKDE